MNPLTWQNPEQLFVAQDIIKVKIYSVAELRFNIFNNNELLFDEIVKMDKTRISNNAPLGYEVLCGGELFHYNH